MFLLASAIIIPLIKFPQVIQAATIFTSGWEAGDVDDGGAWDGTTGTLAVSSSTVYAGSYALEADANGEYVNEDFSASTTPCVNVAVITDADAGGTDTDRFYWYQIYDSAHTNVLAGVGRRNDGGTKKWFLYYRDGAGYSTAYATDSFTVDTWYELEIDCVVDGSAGEFHVYLEGSAIIDVTGLNNDIGASGNYELDVGLPYVSGAVPTANHDSVTIADAHIQAAPGGSWLDNFPLADQYCVYNTTTATWLHIQGSDNSTQGSYATFAQCWTNSYGNLSTTETLVVNGTFTLSSAITVNTNSVTVDFNSSYITTSASTYAVQVSGTSITVKGGNWTGSSSGGAVRFYYATLCTFRDAELSGYNYAGIVQCAYGSTNTSLYNLFIHDVSSSVCVNIFSASWQYAHIENCTFDYYYTGVFVSGTSGYNTIINNNFSRWHVGGGHGIYLDGGTYDGYNNITGNNFQDGTNGAGVLIKCPHNTIYNNTITNLSSGAVGFSLYSQFSGWEANYNLIYNNTLTNVYFGVNFGNNLATEDPTTNNEVYENTFDNVTHCFLMCSFNNHLQAFVNDTVIHTNTFTSCSNIFGSSYNTGSPSYVEGTQFYDNTLDSVTLASYLYDFQASVIYNNTGINDYYMLNTTVSGSGTTNVTGLGYQHYTGRTVNIAWTPLYGNSRDDISVDGVSQSTTTSPYPVVMNASHTIVAYFTGDTYTVTITVNDPDPTTYTSSVVPVSISTSGNETGLTTTWNVQYSNGTWLYGSNQTYSAVTSFTISESSTGLTFCCYSSGAHGASDYAEVEFNVTLTTTYTLTLVVSSPTNTTYTTSPVAVSLSTTGNDSVSSYNWNIQHSDLTWHYASNQSSSTASVTFTENGTYTFYCTVTGAHSTSDSENVSFSVSLADLSPLPSVNVGSIWTFLYAGDFIGFIMALLAIAFTSIDIAVGVIAMIFLVPLYLRTKSLVLLVIAWLLIGTALIIAMPLVSIVAVLFMALGIGGLLYRLFRPSNPSY